MKLPVWTMEDGVTLIRDLQTKALHKGYHLALGGGVLNRGFSYNDLDIVALPLDGKEVVEPSKLVKVFTPYLGTVVTSFDPDGPSVQSGDDARVFVFRTDEGKRIDLLFYTRAGK